MAKRMPYFKFFCSEWNDGDIVFEDYETQGVFINICSLYWSRECNLTKRALERKFPNNLNNILTLQNENILVIDSEDLVIIRFLDQQAKEKDCFFHHGSAPFYVWPCVSLQSNTTNFQMRLGMQVENDLFERIG